MQYRSLHTRTRARGIGKKHEIQINFSYPILNYRVVGGQSGRKEDINKGSEKRIRTRIRTQRKQSLFG